MSYRRNKYGAIKTHSELCGRIFDSKAEAKRGEELYFLQKAGEISALQYQAVKTLSGETHYKCRITIDFSYLKDGERVYEDVKGMGVDRDFRTKLCWLYQLYKIKVNIIKE